MKQSSFERVVAAMREDRSSQTPDRILQVASVYLHACHEERRFLDVASGSNDDATTRNPSENPVTVYDKLRALSISLPDMTPAVGAFVPFVRSGNLLFLSGHIAKRDGKPWSGQLGATVSTEDGNKAARSVAIDLLGTLHAATGDLNRITRLVKLLILVNSTPTFTEQHLVGNGASELLKEVFGEAGAHARSAFGVAQIPFGSCVEIELIAEVGHGA